MIVDNGQWWLPADPARIVHGSLDTGDDDGAQRRLERVGLVNFSVNRQMQNFSLRRFRLDALFGRRGFYEN